MADENFITAYDMTNGITYVGIKRDTESAIVLDDYAMIPTAKIFENDKPTLDKTIAEEYEKRIKGKYFQLSKEYVIGFRKITKN